MPATCLTADDLVLAYERTEVVHGVSVRLEPGAVTALVGPNGSGKSTLLRSLARLHRIGAGRVELATDGRHEDVATLSAREFATKVTLLSQSRPHPCGLVVRDVVAFGRHPHRRPVRVAVRRRPGRHRSGAADDRPDCDGRPRG